MEIKDKTGCAGRLGKAWPTLQQRLLNLWGLTKAAASGYLGILELLGHLPLSPQHLSLEQGQIVLGEPPPPIWPRQNAPGPSLESVNFQKRILLWGRGSGPPGGRAANPPTPLPGKHQGAAFPLLQVACGGCGGEDQKGGGQVSPSSGTPLSGPASAEACGPRAWEPHPSAGGATGLPWSLLCAGVQAAGGECRRRRD